MPRIKFIDLFDRKVSHVIDRTDFFMGRADPCELRIPDPQVSGRQARIQFEQGRYRITNTGQNPIDINGQPVASQPLEDGDLLHVGSTRFLVRILDTGSVETSESAPGETHSASRAHLALQAGDGSETRFSLNNGRTTLGRSPESDIRFEEKNISRRHCAIEEKEGEFTAVRISRTSTVKVNGREIDRCALTSGDVIELGDRVLRFLCETAPGARQETPAAIADGEVTWQRPPHLLVDSASGRTRVFDLEGGRRWHVGRDPDCDLQFQEKSVSRRHAGIEIIDGRFWIENLSQSNPLEINGRAVRRRRLCTGDQVTVGPHTLIFMSKRPEDAPDAHKAEVEHTRFIDSPLPPPPLAPRLILDTGADTARTFHLESDRMILGRSAESDIRLEDPGVSRIHGAVERIEGSHWVVNLCNKNPLRVNETAVEKKQIYAGDRIRLGNTVLAFMSDRPEDARPAPEPSAPEPPRSRPLLRMAVMGIILLLGGYVSYQRLYLPWRISRVLQRADSAFSKDRYDKGRQIVEAALGEQIAPETAEKARRLLADATLKEAQHRIAAGSEDGALKLLTDYLADHGRETDASLVWREQDRIRLRLGEKLEKAGREKAAMDQYAWVRAESLHYAKAEKSLSRLWRTAQAETLLGERRRAAAAVLADQGEALYKAGRYFSPPGQSAYPLFRTALILAPELSGTLDRLAAMGRRHREEGIVQLGRKNWPGALEHLHLALLVAPDDAESIQRLNECRRHLAQAGAGAALGKVARTVKAIALAQQKLAADQTAEMVAHLLKEAETAVEQGKDLAPYGAGAFAAFQAAGELDPENRRARTGLEELRKRVRNRAMEAFSARSWKAAERLLGGSMLIDPGDAEVRERLIDCQKRLGETATGTAAAAGTPVWFNAYR